jgi:hypothetical protein
MASTSSKKSTDGVQLALRLAVVHVQDRIDGHVQEHRFALAGRGAREHGLAATGRAVRQHAAADAFAVAAEEIGPLKRHDDLHADLFLHLVQPADVAEAQRLAHGLHVGVTAFAAAFQEPQDVRRRGFLHRLLDQRVRALPRIIVLQMQERLAGRLGSLAGAAELAEDLRDLQPEKTVVGRLHECAAQGVQCRVQVQRHLLTAMNICGAESRA